MILKIYSKIAIINIIIITVYFGITTSAFAEITDTVEMNLFLDENMVDYPIEEIKGTDYALEYFKRDIYIINHIINNKEVKIQVINNEEAHELGYIDDLVKKIPEFSKVSLGKIPNNKNIVIINDKGKEYKQVIKEEEVTEIENIIKKMNHQSVEENNGNKNELQDHKSIVKYLVRFSIIVLVSIIVFFLYKRRKKKDEDD